MEIKKDIIRGLRLIILLLSLMLIGYISYDTLRNEDFLENHSYMTFQFWVCLVFLADFFIELALSDHKWTFVKRHWFFFALSVPYLNILTLTHLQVSHDTMYVLRFVPLARGMLALGIVLNYISTNKFIGMFVTYMSVVVLVTYFSSMIFYQMEHGINSSVSTYFDAFYWGCTQVTTLGGNIYPVTIIGRVLCCVLSIMGIIKFPLLTVYATSVINKHLHLDSKYSAS